MFYCYVLLDPTIPGKFQYENFSFDYEPFYIGKGKGNRINSHDKPKDTKTHKKAKIQKIKRLGFEVIKIKLFEDLSESSAFELEKSTISIIGRKDKNEGPLLNLTDGGEGSSGRIHSKEEKLHKSKKLKEWWDLLKEDKEMYVKRIKILSDSNKGQNLGKTYEDIYGEEFGGILKKKRSEWCKENFHKTGLGQMDFSGENNPMYGKSIYNIWLDKYGKDEADKRFLKWKENKSGKISWNTNNKKIIQMDKEGNEIKIWDGLHEIFKETGWNKPNISKVLSGDRKFANGFAWKYL